MFISENFREYRKKSPRFRWKRGDSAREKALASPYGRGGPRQRVGEGAGFSWKIQEYRIFALQIFDKPSQSCSRMTALPRGEPRRFAQNGFLNSLDRPVSGGNGAKEAKLFSCGGSAVSLGSAAAVVVVGLAAAGLLRGLLGPGGGFCLRLAGLLRLAGFALRASDFQ